MARVPIGTLCEMRTEELGKLLARYAALTDKAVPELLNSTAVRFAQAAAKATPPAEGRKTLPKSVLYRPIEETGWNNEYKFRVRYRTKKKRGIKLFTSRGEAEKFSAIMNRGAARYGWAGALHDLGQPLPQIVPSSFPFANRAGTLAQALSQAIAAAPGSNTAEIANRADYISQVGQAAGLRVANTGLTHACKRLEKEIANGLS